MRPTEIMTSPVETLAPDTSPAATAKSNGALARAVDTVSAEAHDGVDRVSAAVHPAVDRLAVGAHRSVDDIAVAASRAAETFDTKRMQVKDARVRVTAQCRDYVRENPLASVGLALAAGFVVSRLVKSRSHG